MRTDDWLWQLVDSAFPTGAFAHSGGLEARVAARRGGDPRAAARFVREALWQTATRRAAARRRGDDEPAATRAARCALSTRSYERRGQPREPCAGAGVASHLRADRGRGPLPARDGARARLARAHLAPVFGRRVRASSASRSRRPSSCFCSAPLRGVTSAAVRLGVVGQLRRRSGSSSTAPPSLEGVAARCRDLAATLRADRADRWTCCRRATTGSIRGCFSPEDDPAHESPRARHALRHHTARIMSTSTARARSTSARAPLARDFAQRAFTVGIGGPVGSGKTALLLALCRRAARRPQPRRRHQRHLHARGRGVPDPPRGAAGRADPRRRDRRLPARRDSRRHQPEPASRSSELMQEFQPELLFVESGGDNLAAQFSRELADYTIYVIDVVGRRQDPAQGRPGHHAVGSAGDQQDRSGAAGRRRSRRDGARRQAMRGDGPIVFAQVTQRRRRGGDCGECAESVEGVGSGFLGSGVPRFGVGAQNPEPEPGTLNPEPGTPEARP